MSTATRCDCTARCGDDPGIKAAKVQPCERWRRWNEHVLREAVAAQMLKDMGLRDMLAALQELKAHRAAKRNRMNKYLAGLLGLAAGVAVATEWTPLFTVATGSEWQLRRGSQAIRTLQGTPHLTAYVRLADNKSNAVYLAAVPVQHCGQPRGDVQLLTMDAAPIMQGVWLAGTTTTGAQLARALCGGRK